MLKGGGADSSTLLATHLLHYILQDINIVIYFLFSLVSIEEKNISKDTPSPVSRIFRGQWELTKF